MEPAAAAAAAAAEAAAFGPTHYQQHYAALMASYNRDGFLKIVASPSSSFVKLPLRGGKFMLFSVAVGVLLTSIDVDSAATFSKRI